MCHYPETSRTQNQRIRSHKKLCWYLVQDEQGRCWYLFPKKYSFTSILAQSLQNVELKTINKRFMGGNPLVSFKFNFIFIYYWFFVFTYFRSKKKNPKKKRPATSIDRHLINVDRQWITSIDLYFTMSIDANIRRHVWHFTVSIDTNVRKHVWPSFLIKFFLMIYFHQS